MSNPSRIVFRAARAMISDGVMVSGLALALLGDTYLWRESAHWSGPLVCLVIQVAATAIIAGAGEFWISAGKERSRVDVECGTAGTKRTSTRAAKLGATR
jgi:hypothetical protein